MSTTPPPPRSDRFDILGWQPVPGAAALKAKFRCARFGAFKERVDFPLPAAGFAQMLAQGGGAIADLLAIALGVSYYKAGAAREVRLPPGGTASAAMAKALYTEGLAEFTVRAGLPFPPDVTVKAMTVWGAPTAARPPEGAALVAFGGGKDSYVARAILEKAGTPVTLAAVKLSDAVGDALTRFAPAESPPVLMTRTLDPRLAEATRQGYNGHVPITAINMLVLTLYAMAKGFGQVVFANERSADEPTITLPGGLTANHQYSKSSAFEKLVCEAIGQAAPDAPVVYSVLRPFSELWIGRAMASLKTPFDRFSSCNRNFKIAGETGARWCGNCAKCAFTSLILAPFTTPEETRSIFGEDFLEREALIDEYEALLGLTDHKPWDCVGTIDECRAALHRVAQSRTPLAVQRFHPRLLDAVGADRLEAAWRAGLAPQKSAIIPERIVTAAEGLVP